MKMYNIIFMFMLLVTFLPIFVYVKVRDLGLNKRMSLYIIISFPIIIPKAHIHVFNELRKKNKKQAFKVLMKPIVDFPAVITMYSKSVVIADAKYKAIQELVSELSRQERNKLIKILKQENLKIKIRNKKVKNITSSKGVNIISSKVSNRILNEKICCSILDQQIGVMVKSEVLKQSCI